MEVALVHFIHDQDLVLGQAGLPLDLPQEQPHRQEHDPGGRRARALKADLVADLGGGGGGRSAEGPGPGPQPLAQPKRKSEQTPLPQTPGSGTLGCESHQCRSGPLTLGKQFHPPDTTVLSCEGCMC